MWKLWSAASAALVGWALAVGAHAAPLEAYGRLPTLEQMAVSPDGSKLAYITNVGGKRTIVIQTTRPSKPLLAVVVGQQKARSIDWADSDHLAITTSTTDFVQNVISEREEWFLVQMLDLNRRTLSPLLNVTGALNVTDGPPDFRQVNGRTMAFVGGVDFPQDTGVPTLFSVDIASGRATELAGSPNAEGWVVDGRGQVIAESDYVDKTQRWSLKFKRGDRWQEVMSLDAPIDTPEIEGISPEGDAVVLNMLADGDSELKPVNLGSGAVGKAYGDDRWFSEPVVDPVTHRIIGGQRVTEKTEYVFYDPKDQALWDKIQRAFPGEDVSLQSWTDDRKMVIVQVAGPRDGVVDVAVDFANGRADIVGPVYEGIGPADVAVVQAITYKAADGVEIPAYLTLPNGRPAKDLPLVVLPHGGPAARDDPGFDWWSQALASRGYAVLQPQFRGSDGYGEDLLSAGYGQWGRKMQTDLSDGVRNLVAKGLVDPKRVCIVGASYGGYAAMAGVTLDPGVYRCAVADAGISDLHKFLAWRRAREGYSKSRTLRFWDRFMGSKTPDDPILDQISPAKHLDKLNAPILLIHGKDDTVVPIEQSEVMADVLKKAGKPVEFVTLSGEDHWLSRSETRLQMLEATVKFLETNNPPN